MNPINLIQYVEHHHSQHDAEQSLEALSLLEGYVTGRAYYTGRKYGSAEYTTQAFFENPGELSPDDLEPAGFRLVCVPLKYITNLGK